MCTARCDRFPLTSVAFFESVDCGRVVCLRAGVLVVPSPHVSCGGCPAFGFNVKMQNGDVSAEARDRTHHAPRLHQSDVG